MTAFVARSSAQVFKRLMEGYFASGGTLIGTSNTAPDALYAGGINRQTFAPFVDVLRAHCEIVDLDEDEEGGRGIDYRRRLSDASTSAVADVVIVGDDDDARRRLATMWERFRQSSGETSDDFGDLDVRVGRTRTIRATRRMGDRAVWFTFDDLCGRKSRAAPKDYVALAETFSMICVQDVPRMPTSTAENEARRFINLIDAVYERRVVLLTNLAVNPDELFAELFAESGSRGRDLTLRERTRAENAASGRLAVTAVGGSSGRSTTMLDTDTEWSATGRVGASLADVSAKNFTALAAPRCASRLAHAARLPDYRPDLLSRFLNAHRVAP